MKIYLKHKVESLIDIKELSALEYLDFEGKYADYEERHNFWELCYIESGKMTAKIDGKKSVVNQGNLHFVAPNQLHSYKSDDGNNNKVFVICFECQSSAMKILRGFSSLISEKQNNLIDSIIEESRQTFYLNGLHALETCENPNLGGQQQIILYLETLLIKLIRSASTQENASVTFVGEKLFDAKLVNVIIEHLKENVEERFSLNEICEKINYSKSFICKLFKQETGTTLVDYFNRLKIERAQKFLRETDESAASISRMLNFTDAKYFNTIFKKYTGTTPLLYKKNRYQCEPLEFSLMR